MKIYTPPPCSPRLSAVVPICILLLGGGSLAAQVAPARAPDAATLAKYDTNRNGRLDADEQSALDADQRRAASATAPATAGAKAADEVISLSPFEVISDTKGYYGANTMSGTRFNSKLEDLASSITVMTKEQMSDFAMLDINDVFLYTASAEGTGNYTDFEVNRNGDVQENVSLNPTGANRIRGIAAANVSLGNFETMGRVPVDPLGIDSVEISRGPNASVFGLGNPSGTVNMVPASANLTRNRTQFQARGDSYGGYRTSLDVNRVVKNGLLAVRATGSFQHDGFVRKPSGVNTVRYSGMVKYQPFKKTNITASYAVYRMNGNRPNASPPRDNISYWIANGRPTWDPVAQVVHVNGQTIGNGGLGTTTPITADANVPDYFNRSFTGSGRFYAYVGPGGLELLGTSGSTLNTNPGTGSGTLRYMSVSAGSGIAAGRFTGQPLFTTTPSVSSKALYDWTEQNLQAMNRVMDRTFTSSVSIDQNVIDTPMHRIDAQVSFLREDSQRYTRNIMGELNANGQSGQLLIDPNERLIDGSTNPFFLRPYMGVDQPFTTWQPQKWDTYRAQIGYRLDLTKEKGFLHWLGMHQLSGYDEYKYRINRRYAYKDGIASNHPWIPAGVSRVNQGAITGGPAAAANVTRGYYRYYLGDASGNNIDYAPAEFSSGTYPFFYGNPTTGFVREPTLISQIATTDRTGAGNNSKTILKTLGGVIQSHFLDSRIVTTFGKRTDKQYVKNGSTPQRLTADGMSFDYESINHWAVGDYRFNSGDTTQKGAVVRPFRGWAPITNLARSSGLERFLGQTLNGLSLTYNESDSFRPQDPRVDLYLKPLPNPSGEGKDWGFALNMFDNRFVLRVNSYETQQIKTRGGDAGTIAQRVTRTDVASTAAFLLQTQALLWVAAANPTWTQTQIETEVGRQMGIPWERQVAIENAFDAGLISSTNDIIATGKEIELNYNPTPYWTVAASATKNESKNANVSSDIAQWIGERMPIWTTIRDQRTGQLWWNTNYGGAQTAAQNFAVFVGSPYAVVQQSEGTPNPQIRKYSARFSTNFKLSGITEHQTLRKFEIGGALRWQDKGFLGYYGVQKLPATITDLDRTRPIWDTGSFFGKRTTGHYSLDVNLRYRTRLFTNKIGTTLQLNVRNLQESGGRLQAIGAFPDGTPHTYRIVDPRQFILTATFDL
ncbi:TonB-dependent receptor plug domain-containing protein [Horticoccus sp. 23ND18S-11]|uniref:TonB-dependent receptor plug domain-containing protein n=1 Tax=Horticoccus sp. 23ND18S-11 TaxID=3391832 RepID=UPI0039C9CAB4